jgi:hypothetical protein
LIVVSERLGSLAAGHVRLAGATVAPLVPLALTFVVAIAGSVPMAWVCGYGAFMGVITGWWRAPAALAAAETDRAAVSAGLIGLAIGTAGVVVVDGAVLLIQGTPWFEVVPFFVIIATFESVLVGSALAVPSALVSVWLLRRLVRAPGAATGCI